MPHLKMPRLVTGTRIAVASQHNNVPHFKGLISAHLNPRAQGCDSAFTFCHVLMKNSILHQKMATVRFFLNTAVKSPYSICESCNFPYPNTVVG